MRGRKKPSVTFDTTRAGNFLGVDKRTLERYRATGSGPPFMKYSARCVRYRIADLIAWQESRRVAADAVTTDR
jgi:hypothetical protein